MRGEGRRHTSITTLPAEVLLPPLLSAPAAADRQEGDRAGAEGEGHLRQAGSPLEDTECLGCPRVGRHHQWVAQEGRHHQWVEQEGTHQCLVQEGTHQSVAQEGTAVGKKTSEMVTRSLSMDVM